MAHHHAQPGRTAADLRPLVEFLAAVFWGGDHGHGVAALLTRIPDLGQSVCAAGPAAAAAHAELAACAADAAPLAQRDLEAAYVALFVAARTPVPAPLYQSCHEEGRLMGAAALAMNRRLARAGLAVGAELSEPADHLCIELEYLYWLLDRAAASGAEGSEAGSGGSAALAEAASFAREVMLPWVERFAAKIEEAGGPAFFAASARLLVAVLRAAASLDGEQAHGRAPDHSCQPST